MASWCGRILVRGRALFGVFGVLHWYCLRFLSLVVEVLSTDPGVSGGRSLLLSVVPTYSRGSGDIGVIQYVGYGKA